METIRVAVTGGAGQIAYSLLPTLINGSVFGPDKRVILQLLDIPPAMTALGGVVMELEDLAYPLYAGAVATDDPNVAFKDVDFAIFLGAFPRKEGMERKDMMEKNIGIFNAQARGRPLRLPRRARARPLLRTRRYPLTALLCALPPRAGFRPLGQRQAHR